MERRQIGQTMAGVMVIAIGVMILGFQMGWWGLLTLRGVGPVLMIILGAAMLVAGRHRGEPGAALALMGGGTVLLLHTSGTLPFSTSWPLLVVTAGLMILLGHGQAGSCSRKDPNHVA
jgi:hypothetical protein